jgi:hypothetical protein
MGDPYPSIVHVSRTEPVGTNANAYSTHPPAQIDIIDISLLCPEVGPAHKNYVAITLALISAPTNVL